MGTVKHNLAKESFAGIEQFFKNDLRVEVSEAVHLHWRDVRLLMTPNQFIEFTRELEDCYTCFDGELKDEDIVLGHIGLSDDVLLDPIVSLEEQENGCVHFHYKDTRIEMTQDAFVKMACMFEKAKSKYFEHRETSIPLLAIDPYDHIHKPTFEEWISIDGYSREHLVKDYNEHRVGRLWMAMMITMGFQIKPIIVTELENDRYKRRDGFKRFEAYKLLNMTHIPCYVVSEEVALTMPQDKEFPFWGFSK